MSQHTSQIDELLGKVFLQAPQIFENIFTWEGRSLTLISSNISHGNLMYDIDVNGTLASLNTLGNKIAYLIQIIALQLHRASKEIDPTVSPYLCCAFGCLS